VPTAASGVQIAGNGFTIIATNDLHGQLTSEVYSFSRGRRVGGAACLKAYIDGFRREGPALLVDDGDFMQGAPESGLFEGKPVVEYMNAAGYQAAAVGNHEFDWGIDVLAQRASEAKFPLLCANLLDARTGQPFAFTQPSTIVEVGGAKVGLIGVITETTPGIVSAGIRERIRVTSAAEAAIAQSRALRAQGAKVIVLLAHLGGTQAHGHGGEAGEISGEVARLAAGLGGAVDIIVSGHTHTKLNGRVNGITITQAYSRGTALARIGVPVDASGTPGQPWAEIITTYADQVTPDAAVQALLKPYLDEVDRKLSATVGEAAENITTKGDDQSPMGSLVADAIREAAGAQVAVTNAGGVRSGIMAGKVTLRTIFDIMPFDNLVRRGRASGAVVVDILAHSADQRTPLQVSGVVVYGRNAKLRAQLTSGEEIRPDGRYLIAANDFIWDGAEGFDMFPPADAEMPATLVRDALAQYATRHSPLRSPDTDRWR
jgi:2',3'-cyclic-nucleotide 2'-phosphodiesterase/3'-nucleotidase